MDILEVLGKIGFDWRVSLINLFNFIIIFLILKKFAFKPIERMLEKRELKIKKGLDDAEKSSKLLSESEKISEEIRLKAKNEANIIIANSKKKGDDLIFKSKEKATEEGREILTSAHEKSIQDRLKMEKEFKNESIDLVFSVVEKVLKEDIDQERNEIITKKIISNIK